MTGAVESATGGIRIGSRGSALAMVQAELVRAALAQAGTVATIVVIETAGDRRAPDTAWGEGAFVAAIERAVLDGRVDVAVHSAKDVPTDEHPRLRIAAYLPRADARDALVLRPDATERSFDELPAGSRVGTDSPRRVQFLRARRPDLRFQPLHGNVDTRLRRLDAGETDALVLACAGLDRLGRSDRIVERLDPGVVPPAPGQGAIAVQIRSSDEALSAICRGIDDPPTRVAVEAERSFLRAAGGGCRAPIGALATVADGTVTIRGGHDRTAVGRPVFGGRSGPAADPAGLGRLLAADLGIATTRSSDGGPADIPRVIVTRPAGQNVKLTSALRQAGLDPVFVPAIEIDFASGQRDVDRAARSIRHGVWVVVTSANGARAILDAAERVPIDLGAARWAAIGPATRAALARGAIDVEFSPSHPTAAALAAELPIAARDAVVVLRGDLAESGVATTLRDRGAVVDDVVAYRTGEAPAASRPLLQAAVRGGPIGAIVFTSGSTARGLATLARDVAVDLAGIPVVCIGEPTAMAAAAAGFTVGAVSPDPDVASLALITADVVGHRAARLVPQLEEVP